MCINELLFSATNCRVPLSALRPLIDHAWSESRQSVRVTVYSCIYDRLGIAEAARSARVDLSCHRIDSRICNELELKSVAGRIDSVTSNVLNSVQGTGQGQSKTAGR